MSFIRWAAPSHSPKPQSRVSIVFAPLVGHFSLVVDPGSYTLTGVDASLEVEGGVPTDYVLDCQPATFAVTGTDATVPRTHLFRANPGLFFVRAGAPNSVPNGGFEVNASGWEGYTGGTGTRVSYTSASLPAAFGDYALEVVSAGVSSGVVSDPDYADMIVVSPNTAYVFSVWFYSTTAFNPNIAFNEYEPGPTLVGGAATGGLIPANTWTEIYLTDTLSATTDRLHLFVHTPVGPAMTFWVDGITVTQGSLPTLYGNETTFSLLTEYALDCQPGSYTVTGVEATLTYSAVLPTPPRLVNQAVKAHSSKPLRQVSVAYHALALADLTHYSLDCQPGVFALEGVSTSQLEVPKLLRAIKSHTSKPQRRVSIAVQAFAQTFDLNAEPATIAVTGSDATVAYGKFLTVSPAAYTLTGVQALPQQVNVVNSPVAVYNIAAVDPQLAYSGAFDKIVSPVYAVETKPNLLGTRVFYGNTAAPPPIPEIPAFLGAFAVTGTAATLTHAVPGAYVINAEPYTVVYSALDATILVFFSHYSFDSQPGTVAVTGVDANLTTLVSAFLAADPGVYTVTGAATTLPYGKNLDAAVGAFVVTVNDASFGGNRAIAALPPLFRITGTAATLRVAVVFMDDHVSDVLTMTDHTSDALTLTDH